jgi:hypothetical protein
VFTHAQRMMGCVMMQFCCDESGASEQAMMNSRSVREGKTRTMNKFQWRLNDDDGREAVFMLEFKMRIPARKKELVC